MLRLYIKEYSMSLPYHGGLGWTLACCCYLDRVRATQFNRCWDKIISFDYTKRAFPLGNQDVIQQLRTQSGRDERSVNALQDTVAACRIMVSSD